GGLGQVGERQQHAHLAADGAVDAVGEGGEEVGRGVREGVAAEGAERDGGHGVQVAPQERLGEQQDVAAGQEDRLVGGGGVRHRLAADAPVAAGVEVAHGLFEGGGGLDGGAGQGRRV